MNAPFWCWPVLNGSACNEYVYHRKYSGNRLTWTTASIDIDKGIARCGTYDVDRATCSGYHIVFGSQCSMLNRLLLPLHFALFFTFARWSHDLLQYVINGGVVLV